MKVMDLHNEFDVINEVGKKLRQEFQTLIEKLIKDSCRTFNTIEVQKILVEEVESLCILHRLYKASNKRKILKNTK